MRAQLKSLMTSDIDPDSYWPDEEDNFGFYIQAIIGPEDEEGGDIFGFQVCSPKWLQNKHSVTDIVFIRHVILMFEYDYQAVERRIADLCNKTIGADWGEIASKIARFGSWEFEDYQSLSIT